MDIDAIEINKMFGGSAGDANVRCVRIGREGDEKSSLANFFERCAGEFSLEVVVREIWCLLERDEKFCQV